MNIIKVRKNKLLEILKSNREKHRAIFEDALIGYRELAIEKLDEALDDAREGRKINMYFALVEPMDQTEDYDRAIGMLEMSVDDEVEMDRREYDQYVMDNWDWTGQFSASNATYTTMIQS